MLSEYFWKNSLFRLKDSETLFRSSAISRGRCCLAGARRFRRRSRDSRNEIDPSIPWLVISMICFFRSSISGWPFSDMSASTSKASTLVNVLSKSITKYLFNLIARGFGSSFGASWVSIVMVLSKNDRTCVAKVYKFNLRRQTGWAKGELFENFQNALCLFALFQRRLTARGMSTNITG